jgi:ABC-type phosphate transport system substrate-binding protein
MAPIRVVGRDDRSGSRRALETYVLEGRQAGATSDSCDALREGVVSSQPRSFANYLVGAEARSMVAAQQYAPTARPSRCA